MYRAPAVQSTLPEAFGLRHSWIAALVVGTMVTPLAILLALLAPARAGTALVWPMVLLVKWAGSGPSIGPPEHPVNEATPVQLAAAGLGLALSWAFYVLAVRVVLWRVAKGREERAPIP